jgi:hypothetical protein
VRVKGRVYAVGVVVGVVVVEAVEAEADFLQVEDSLL